MYKLFKDKDKLILRVETIGNLATSGRIVTDEITNYNDNYLICNDKKMLINKAEEIRSEWIKEVEDRLIKLNDLKIKIK